MKNLEGGRYYIVEYTFYDYFGNKRVYEIKKYVFGYEEEMFKFRDISKGMTYYDTWKYKILPQK
ncbi:MAG: hypothetical protein PF542_05685 [Nanoarchaeota archaeon]|nr:hypothetical protein [Nanoarchaeota archaeon]